MRGRGVLQCITEESNSIEMVTVDGKRHGGGDRRMMGEEGGKQDTV